jgi:hypothetical protein
MSDEMTVKVDGEDYVVRAQDGGMQVGRRVAGEVTWLETVDGGLLPDGVSAALERGDGSDESLLAAVRGVVQAEVERGG